MSKNSIRKALVGMLESKDNDLCEFEKILKFEKEGSERNKIRHDMDLAVFLRDNPKTPLMPAILEMRSAMVLKTLIILQF